MLSLEGGDHAVARGAVLITGGAGFIGSNLAARLLDEGREVIVYDNMSRPGAAQNLKWLAHVGGARLGTFLADTRDARALREAVRHASCVFHLAAQGSVTASFDDPVTDFEINLRGTLNLLEAIRRAPQPPSLVFASSSAVYGALPDIALTTTANRYRPDDAEIRLFGISEACPTDFCSPCGCSKGAADQYVLDYARSFGIAAVVLRTSSIYGPRQWGSGGEGWVAHFLLQAMRGLPITLYGDGLQVRDILYVDDLVDALLLCGENRDALCGRAFNIGGGTGNTVSRIEMLDMIGRLRGRAPRIEHTDMRTWEPRYFVADTRRFGSATGWRPRVHTDKGVARLFRWLSETSDATSELGKRVA